MADSSWPVESGKSSASWFGFCAPVRASAPSRQHRKRIGLFIASPLDACGSQIYLIDVRKPVAGAAKNSHQFLIAHSSVRKLHVTEAVAVEKIFAVGRNLRAV